VRPRFPFLAMAARLLLAGLVSCVALVAIAQESGPNMDSKGETPAEAKARLTAWFETRNLPLWRGRAGKPGKWTEIGPSVLKNGWGGMDNAGRCISIAIDPQRPRTVYVGAASGGIWRSDDEGKTWKPLSDDAAGLSVGALAIDPFNPQVIYAGTGEPNGSIDSFHGVGMLRSTDGGRTWSLLAADVYIGIRFTSIIPNPKRPGFLYASSTRGVLRSLDSGGTWVELLKGHVSELIMDPRNPSSLIAAIGPGRGTPNSGLWRSDDSGQTWRRLTKDLPADPRALGRLQMSLCQAYPNVVVASFYKGAGGLEGVYKSTNFGESWVRLPNAPDYAGGQAWYDNYVSVSPTNPNVIFLGGTSTYRSIDGGETWEDNTRSYAGGQVHPDHHALIFSPDSPQTVYLATDGGMFRSRNLGQSWEAINDGLATVQFQSVDVHPWDENIAFGGTQDNGTNMYEGNLAWTNTFLGDGGTTRVNFRNPDIVYTEYVNLTICKSTDGGRTWRWNTTRGIDPREGKNFYAPFNLDPSDPDTLVAGAQRVYRSTDAAENWTPISPILGSRVSAVVVAPSARSVIYAGTNDGRVWVTHNTGKDWTEITRGLQRAYVGDILVDPKNARVVYVGLSTWEGQTVWKSTDAGWTWTQVSDNLPPVPIHGMALDPQRPERIFLATAVGVFISEQGGGRWLRLGEGLPNCPVFSIVANPRTNWITVGTHGRGAWRFPLND
jgi:photosystem II stability/assembly factor-like uncharacterized protein